jgi:hypothetical protein
MGTEELFNSGTAGQILSEALPAKTPEQWALWLRNNRNQSRPASYRVTCQHFAGGVFYLREDLMKFVEWEKARQLGTIKLSGRTAEVIQAFGLGESGGGSYGRKLAYNVLLGFEEDNPKSQFVRLMIERPLGVFRLSADEADALARELQEAASAIRRHAEPTTTSEPDMSDYEIVTDNACMVVRRLKAPK